MRICYICADPGIPLFGRKGCSTHVRETCRVLQDLGHEVRLICSNVEGDEADKPLCDIVRVKSPRSKKLGFDLRHVLLDRRLGRRLAQLIETWKPHAIYERYSLYSCAGLRVCDRHGLPRLLEVNAFLTKEQKGRIRFPWLARRVERRIIRRAPRVIVVSEPLRQEVHALGVSLSSIAKMPMAVNLERFRPEGNGQAIRARLGLEGRFVIGYVGTLSGWHGIRLFYDTARRLKEQGAAPFVFLVVGGEGKKLELNRLQTIEAGLEDEIRFIGSVPHEQVPSYIRAMDAAMVPDTTYWSSPAKLFEYQATGVPVLAPSYPAIHESLEHGREGLIYPPRDIEQMTEMVTQLMRDPDLCRRMGQAARRRAELEHSWRHNGEQILTLFHELGVDIT